MSDTSKLSDAEFCALAMKNLQELHERLQSKTRHCVSKQSQIDEADFIRANGIPTQGNTVWWETKRRVWMEAIKHERAEIVKLGEIDLDMEFVAALRNRLMP